MLFECYSVRNGDVGTTKCLLEANADVDLAGAFFSTQKNPTSVILVVSELDWEEIWKPPLHVFYNFFEK